MKISTFVDILIVSTGLLCVLNYNKFLAIYSRSELKNNKIKRYNELMELNKIASEGAIVFAGDSITRWYPIDELFTDCVIYNRGNAGYLTSELLDVFEETIISIKPSKIFILIGTNDMSMRNITPEIALENTLKMLDKVKLYLPYTEIYLISIYPINVTKNKMISEKIYKMKSYYSDKIFKLNRLYKKMCNENDVIYVDLFNKLCDENNQLNLNYTVDGLHLSIEGYRIITENLKKYML